MLAGQVVFPERCSTRPFLVLFYSIWYVQGDARRYLASHASSLPVYASHTSILPINFTRQCVRASRPAGNLPDLPTNGWIAWLAEQRKKGLLVSSPTASTSLSLCVFCNGVALGFMYW